MNVLQQSVNMLEAYKRRLGREYDRCRSPKVASKYNEVEDNIRCLCSLGFERTNKPYYIDQNGGNYND